MLGGSDVWLFLWVDNLCNHIVSTICLFQSINHGFLMWPKY